MSRVYSSVKINKFQSSDLAELISRMQRNFDRVEKTIQQSEELLAVDKERDRQNMTRIHKRANANNLTEADRLLKELFVDLEKSKKMQHPQAQEIEKDMKFLHDRLARACAIFRDLYNQTLGFELTQTVNVRAVVEVDHPQRAVTVQSSPGDPRAADLASELDRIYRDLEQCEEQIRGRLRAPLENRSPTQDLTNRLRELEKSAQTVSKLESEKAAVQREMGPILAKKPLEPAASSLPPKLSATDSKIDDINTLIDLYNKKASASMNLEKQIRYMDSIVSGFEEQLAKDGVILDEEKALEKRNRQLQLMHKDIASNRDELKKLGRDLDLTERACSHLQYSFNEYCPDLQHQEDEVMKLNNQYTTVKKELRGRLDLIKEATSKNQDFQTALQSLDFFLVNLPNNAIRLTDDVEQIRAKQNSQMRVVEDIRSKSRELDRVRVFSRDLQRVLNEYEVRSYTYRGTLTDEYDYDDDEDRNDELILWRRQTLAQAIQRKEKNLLNFYSEVSAVNNQLLIQLETARNIKAKNEEKVTRVFITQQQQSQRRDLEENVVCLKTELSEETSRRLRVEHELETYRGRLAALRNRKGVERVEEKEVVLYYRDPKLEMELQSLTKLIQDETFKRSRFHQEIEVYKEKITKVQLIKIEPKLMTRIMTEYERDLQLDREAARIRDEMQRIRLEFQTRDTKVYHLKTELTVLAQQKTKIRERVIKKEVVRFEKDPEMLNAVLMFKSDIATVESHCKSLNESISSTRSQINTLERVISTIQPREVTRVVTQVQQDPETLEELNNLRIALEEERREYAILMKDMRTLQLRYSEVEKVSIRVEVKEIINEIYRVTPEMEAELVRLRKERQEWSHKLTILEKEMNTVMTTRTTLRAQKPIVEYREVIQEVVKFQNSPEVTRELQTITSELSRLQRHYNSTLELLTTLCQERDMLKVEKSKVETKTVVKELIRYENDPLLEKEADRLRRTVREESQLYRSVEESLTELRNQYIFLQQQKQEERIVVMEVVRLQKDHKQILEHERLSRILNEEMAARRQLEIDVRQLRTLIREKETSLSQMDVHQIRIQLDSELRQIKSRIYEFENKPIQEKVVIEEVFKVERDAELDKVIAGLRVDLETEATNISRVETETRNLAVKLEVLQKEKSVEKVIYREVVRIEKDQAVEAELAKLRQLVTQERNLRCDQENKIQTITIKITNLQTSKSVTSEETTRRDALQREKEDLLRQLKMLESQRQNITITFQQESRLVSERNEIALQKSLQISSEIQRLEKEVLTEKDKIHQKDSLIIELQNSIKQEEHSVTHTTETSLSTKVTIMDPETGKDMSPYDAYMRGLITRDHYIRLSKLECNWEEITSTGPDGDTVILQDRKSGKQYSIKDALRDGRLTQLDLMNYKEGKMHIAELALLVVGETKPTPLPPVSSLNSMQSSRRSSYTSLNTHYSGSLNHLNASAGEEHFPISGIFDTTTESRMSVRSALTNKLIDSDMALMLLEAQAASGGIIDLSKKDKLSVHKAAAQGLIDQNDMYKLLNAQKAFTGVEDPVTQVRLAVGLAVQKGYMPAENARRYMEAQYLTGGLVNPAKAGRITVQEALANNLIDSRTADQLLDETSHTKGLVDPLTKEKISYKQAMDRCKRDTSTGLLLLPAASTDASNAPSYSNYRFNSSHSKY